jgi:hypothetical protein
MSGAAAEIGAHLNGGRKFGMPTPEPQMSFVA